MDADEIVTNFCDAWDRADLEAIMAAFSDDALYHNIPMAPCKGKDQIRAFIEGFLGDSGIHFEILHQVVKGPIVMNERIDSIQMGDRTIDLKVCGVFELTPEGKIAAWRDYFDMAAFSATE